MVVNGIDVALQGDEISEEELKIYLSQLQSRQKVKITSAKAVVDGQFVDVTFTTAKMPFDRIRRITGYLVGTTRRWNDAKQAELNDRLKHC